MHEKRRLEIIKNNKKIQNILYININDYKRYCEIYSSIELEIIPSKSKYGKFINIEEPKDRKYYHIYFNDDKKEIQNFFINENDNISKINIRIDYQIKSFKDLFMGCSLIEYIYFKKFHRKNINNTRRMFSGCSSLKLINFSSFNTNDVTSMGGMFSYCSSLKEINLPFFNTNNVIDMGCMFNECSSLKEINLSSFNTNNVMNMNGMFNGCSSLKEINLSSFNTNYVINMGCMFNECSSL